MLNPALIEIAARQRLAEGKRLAEAQREGAARPSARRRLPSRGSADARTASMSIEQHLKSTPMRAVGWFLIGVGLRLAVPGSRGGSGR